MAVWDEMPCGCGRWNRLCPLTLANVHDVTVASELLRRSLICGRFSVQVKYAKLGPGEISPGLLAIAALIFIFRPRLWHILSPAPLSRGQAEARSKSHKECGRTASVFEPLYWDLCMAVPQSGFALLNFIKRIGRLGKLPNLPIHLMAL